MGQKERKGLGPNQPPEPPDKPYGQVYINGKWVNVRDAFRASKGLGPDLSTVDRELAKLFSKAKYPKPVRSTGPYTLDWLQGDRGEPFGPIGPLYDLYKEYNKIIPGVTSSLNAIVIPRREDFYKYSGYSGPGTAAGYFNPKYRNISVNPDYSQIPPSEKHPFSTESILAHELAHAGGFEHGRHLSNIEGVGRMRGEYKEQFKKGIK